MKTVFFDLDDTLYDQLQPFQAAYDKTFSTITEIPVLDLFKKSREYSDKVFTQTENGELPLEKMHQNRMIHAFQQFGVSISAEQADAFQQTYQEHQYKISLVPEMVRILEYLTAKGILSYVVTNGPSAHQRKKVQSLDLLQWLPEEHLFISSEMGYAKPQKEYFDHVNAKTKTIGSHCYMIGDSFENDIVGAHQAGWNSIWVNPKRKPKTVPSIQPHYEIHSYQQLEALIKELF
ncbi:HAD family hydrolase [Neobacillus jeddahensis]|uniref:HAD family hydrolase n=1 Tax=Neobacillus jeddahensis TaxID=1461580 RepID=UPI00058DCABC|nr:HAD family hydrolase [Neobacillus jeddahensis]